MLNKIIELKTNIRPPKRSEFGLCSSENNVYIYGGLSQDNKYFDDLWHMKRMLYVDQ